MSEAASADTLTASDPIQNAEESQKGLTMKTSQFTVTSARAHPNADLALVPPFVCNSGAPHFIPVSGDVMVLAAEDRVGVYVRNGDDYVLRGAIDLSVREMEQQ